MTELTEDQIRARAHELWQKAGEPEGKQQEFWFQAERELQGKSAASKTEEGSKTFIE